MQRTFFDECPAYSKDETTACSLHMFWDLDLSKTAAAIATTACVDSDRQEVAAAAFRIVNNTGAFAFNSFKTSVTLNSNKLSIDEDRSSDGDGNRLHNISHSLRIVQVTSFTVAWRKV